MLLGDLIEGVATDIAQPKAMVEAIVRAALARIEGAVGKRETVNLVGFGRFEVYERSARRARNLRTGEAQDPGHSAVRFTLRQASSGMPLPDRSARGPGKARSSCSGRPPSSCAQRNPRGLGCQSKMRAAPCTGRDARLSKAGCEAWECSYEHVLTAAARVGGL